MHIKQYLEGNVQLKTILEKNGFNLMTSASTVKNDNKNNSNDTNKGLNKNHCNRKQQNMRKKNNNKTGRQLLVQINTKSRPPARQNDPEKERSYKLSISGMREVALLQILQVLREY